MDNEHKEFLEKEEQFYIDKIMETLKKNKGKALTAIESSHVESIHTYVNQIVSIHQTRSRMNQMMPLSLTRQ